MKSNRSIVAALLAASATWHGLSAQTTPAAKPSSNPEEVIQLSPFEVTSSKDTGYQATDTLAGTRIRTDLKDVSSAISVYTKDFLNDIGATDSGSLLQYTTNAEVSGTLGSYTGLGNGTTLDESANLRSPQSAQRIRGLASADNTRDYFITDIPWDSFNVDRVDILRGPNSFLFGLGSPAGIVNASIQTAEFRNTAKVETRTGSYGSFRNSLNVNQQLIENVLAIRVAGLSDDARYEQKQAYQDQRRGFVALRFDPRLFDKLDSTATTSLKIKAENGTISADRPRTIAPYDSITPWFNSMGKLSLATPYTAGSNPGAVSKWITQSPGNVQQPVWLIDGSNNQQSIYGGVINTGALNASGVPQNASTELTGVNYAFEEFGLNSIAGYASAAGLPNSGQYRSRSLTDPSIFDFYHNLIDGPTKSEWEKWNTANVDLSQTFLSDRIGIDLSFDHQKYKNGSQALLSSPAITIDILQNQADLTANPNYGRPYVGGGTGSGGSYASDRKFYRASLFGELRPSDFIKNSFLLTLFGKQRLNGVAADEKFYSQNNSWQMYANSQAWAGYTNQNSGALGSISDRAPSTIIYLGSSLKNATTAAGANIPGITTPITLQNGSVYTFASTWKNVPGVDPKAPWTVPTNLQTQFSATGGTNYSAANPVAYSGYTQASNPANYVGWNNNFNMNVLSYDNGANQSLLTKAQQSLRQTNSFSGSYQGFFLADSLVATLGWRYDEVKTKDVTAQSQAANRNILDVTAQDFALPAAFPIAQIKKGHSTSESFVFQLNKVLDHFLRKDPLPLNVGLTFTNSSNFQVTSIRRNVYGNTEEDPSGATREYGAWVSTKDGKFSLRVVKYTTTLNNNDSGLSGISSQIGTIVQQGLKWRNVFLYQLGAYTIDTQGASYRNTWTNSASSSALYNLSPADAQAREDAAITGWNNIQKTLETKGYFTAWNYTPLVPDADLVNRTTYLSNIGQYTPPANTVTAYVATPPQGFTVTADTVSRGYEYEFTYNPLPNWRIAFNASESTAVRTNFGGPVLDGFMAYMQSQLVNADGSPTPAGQIPQFGGPGNIVTNYWAPLIAQYQLLKAQEGANVPEIRKWRYNVINNYTFDKGVLRNVSIGGAYRWMDKIAIGYPVLANGTYDEAHPYYGPTEAGLDLWVGYERRLSKKINWKIQLNVQNVGAGNKLIPITVEPDGSWAAARIAPTQQWFMTNTFSF